MLFKKREAKQKKALAVDLPGLGSWVKGQDFLSTAPTCGVGWGYTFGAHTSRAHKNTMLIMRGTGHTRNTNTMAPARDMLQTSSKKLLSNDHAT